MFCGLLNGNTSGYVFTTVKYRWKELMDLPGIQYATRIVGGVLFHLQRKCP